MDAQRTEALLFLCSLASVPLGCRSDRTLGDTSAASMTTASTTSDGASMITEADDVTSGSAAGTSAADGSATTADTTNEWRQFCEAYAQKMVECFPTRTQQGEFIDCYLYESDFVGAPPECHDASVVFLMCELAASCPAHQAGDPCLGEQSEVELYCASDTD